jgi:hypothetical protein
MREEFQELHERLDFAERLLSRERRDFRPPEPTDTPV